MPHNPRAAAVLTATAGRQAGFSVRRGNRRLVFDQPPTPVRNKAGEVVGVEAMVRLFEGSKEIPIDPHRVIINPPTVPRANLTWEEGTHDPLMGGFIGLGKIVSQKTTEKGKAYRRIVGAPDPEAALTEAIWDSVDLTPNAPGWRTRGTVTTVFATAPGGAGTAYGVSTVYLTARSTFTTARDAHWSGQWKNGADFNCYESAIIFDTSGLPDTDVVSDVVLSCDGNGDLSTTDFTVTAAASSYNGGPVGLDDWIAGASLSGQTTYATWATSGYSANYNAFTSAGAAFNSAINTTGNTALMLYSDRHSAGTEPTGTEIMIFTDADAAGTSTDPKLDITHAAAATTVPMLMLMGVGT